MNIVVLSSGHIRRVYYYSYRWCRLLIYISIRYEPKTINYCLQIAFQLIHLYTATVYLAVISSSSHKLIFVLISKKKRVHTKKDIFLEMVKIFDKLTLNAKLLNDGINCWLRKIGKIFFFSFFPSIVQSTIFGTITLNSKGKTHWNETVQHKFDSKLIETNLY